MSRMKKNNEPTFISATWEVDINIGLLFLFIYRTFLFSCKTLFISMKNDLFILGRVEVKVRHPRLPTRQNI